jgi:hypothetical protein
MFSVGFLGDVEQDSDAAGLGGQAEVARPSFSVSSRCLRAENCRKTRWSILDSFRNIFCPPRHLPG